MVTRNRCGDGVSVAMTVPPSGGVNDLGPKLRVLVGDHKQLNSSAIVEMEAENAHFQPSA